MRNRGILEEAFHQQDEQAKKEGYNLVFYVREQEKREAPTFFFLLPKTASLIQCDQFRETASLFSSWRALVVSQTV
jgi:hypothetical protein